MTNRLNRLDRVVDPSGDRTDPRRVLIDREIRRRAIADADRAFEKVRDDLRRLARDTRSSRQAGGR
jgi:hypothetical protein